MPHDLSKSVVGINKSISGVELIRARDEERFLAMHLEVMVSETIEFLNANPETKAIYREYGLMIRLRLEPIPQVMTHKPKSTAQ